MTASWSASWTLSGSSFACRVAWRETWILRRTSPLSSPVSKGGLPTPRLSRASSATPLLRWLAPSWTIKQLFLSTNFSLRLLFQNKFGSERLDWNSGVYSIRFVRRRGSLTRILGSDVGPGAVEAAEVLDEAGEVGDGDAELVHGVAVAKSDGVEQLGGAVLDGIVVPRDAVRDADLVGARVPAADGGAAEVHFGRDAVAREESGDFLGLGDERVLHH